MSEGYKSISFTSPSGSWKSGVGVPGQFPAGLRVLVVDDDSTCLQILDKMLRNCLYKVTKCSQAEVALQLLREEKDGFDIVISDVHMPDMDGFKLLELIGLEMDLPVIMMSADDTRSVVMQGVTHGACDYLIKPVHMGALNNIWQHVVRKKKYEWKEKDSEQSGSAEDGVQLRKPLEDVDDSSRNEGHCKNFKKRKDDVDEVEERDDTSTMKKQRVVWSPELRMQFEIAVNLLGVDKAVPKKILEIMNVAGLTRENVASHLQKYRQSLTRMNALGSSFMRPANTSFSAISSLNGVDLQVDIPSNQLSRHCVSSIQTPSLGRSATKPTTFVSPVDQKRILSFENSKIRFMEGEGPRQPSSNVEQVNMLHGSPTDMDSKKLSILDPAAQFAFGSINLHIRSPANQNNLLQSQMVLTHPSSPVFNQTNGANIMNLTSVNQPQMIPSVASLVRRDFCGPVYSVSQPSTIVDFSSSQETELPGNSCSLVSSSGVSTLSPRGILQEEVNSEVKGHQSFLPDHDFLKEQNNHNRNQDWVMYNGGSSLVACQNPNFQVGMETSTPSLVHSGFSLNQKCIESKTDSAVADGMDNQQHDNSFLYVKADKFGDIELNPESIGRDDLMNFYDKVHQGMDDKFGNEAYENASPSYVTSSTLFI